ncbi:hypothetical protein M436DRAFT_85128 [Aureobasidium namibiae CBS 147.97]|uniref:Chromo domain-containing protein n=1 Tax=Aureobasidium namibiae CBS 147.97 TaxID=1043004 RepID=A0A074X509_9PEZI
MSTSQDIAATDTGTMLQGDSDRDASWSSDRASCPQVPQTDQELDKPPVLLNYTLDPEDMLDNFQGNLSLLYRALAHLVLAHGTVDALYHAFRAVATARKGTQNSSNQSDHEEIVEVLALAEEIVQEMLDRGFGQAAAQTVNVTQTCIIKYDPVRDVPESQIPRTPRRSLRPRGPTAPKFSKQKSPQKATSPQKNRSPRRNQAPQKRKVAAAYDVPKDLYYTIRGILDEHETGYLVDWENIGSQSFSPTWEPKGNVTDLAIGVWEEEKKKIKNR